MAWKLRKDPEWNRKIPVFKFDRGSGVCTRMGIEDRGGKLQTFLIQLDEKDGVRHVVKETAKHD